jgi:hypothetical protein
LAIVLTVILQFRASDYQFGIFKPFFLIPTKIISPSVFFNVVCFLRFMFMLKKKDQLPIQAPANIVISFQGP